MDKNIVVCALEKIIGTDKLDFISGTVAFPGTKDAKLTDTRGSVYGFAIKLCDKKAREDFVKKLNGKDYVKADILKDWKPIAEDFYPLYWGKDKNIGVRISAHVHDYKNTGTIQINKRNELMGEIIIYGVMLCENYTGLEAKLREIYPDIYRTSTSSVFDAEEAKYEDICNEE